MNNQIKYVLECILALVLFLTTFIFLSLVFVFLWFSTATFPIYTQARIGKNEKIFILYKFKTIDNEVVLNRLCYFLRISKIDELPQLLNIIKGEMSFVGPRPLLPEYLPLFSEIQKTRHKVRPGITGLAQVQGANLLQWEQRLALDVQYIQEQSLLLDMKIVLKTVLLPFKKNKGKHFSEKFEGNN